MTNARRISVLGDPVDIQHLLSNKPPVLDEVLPGLLAGTVGMLAGAGGLGKTMLELQIATALAAGLSDRDGLLSAWSGSAVKRAPQRVVLVAAEEPLDIVWTRLHAILATLNHRDVVPSGRAMRETVQLLSENLAIYPLAGRKRLNLLDDRLRRTRDVDELEAACVGARLVMLDPLRQVHVQDENSSGAMSALVSQFKALAHETGAAVVFAHHTSRASDWQGLADSASAARGSTALSADVRWQLNLTSLSKDQARQAGVKPEEAHRFVQLHQAKQNYGQRTSPLLLQRLSGGVLQAAKQPASVAERPKPGPSRGRVGMDGLKGPLL